TRSSRREEALIPLEKTAARSRGGITDLPIWLPLIVLAALAFRLRTLLPAWGFMWVMAAAIFLGCKWLTWWQCKIAAIEPWRNFAYLLLWPGLDAAAFLGTSKPRDSITRTITRMSWLAAFGKMLFGAVLLWGIVRTLPASSPLLAGWCGLLGLIFLLHFGAFHLLALAWQHAGVDARPLMRAPILSTSLGEFWGKRWNLAFSHLAFGVAFRPVLRRLGAAWATIVVFLVSGLVHELVISVPAGGGYGLPTLYFLLQAAGILIERSVVGRKLGLRRGFAGWSFTAVFTAGPVFWLFHPPFIHHVILPFFKAIHAM
ncbi:MAG TPA: membrane bound O-acyl transferase family-domain-containing protein, partial [Verrucomicrobiae bacterium]|nr:membrane bound O-acyl transferase family-domain-containing protein [Verrucomicrobiae bacterium]